MKNKYYFLPKFIRGQVTRAQSNLLTSQPQDPVTLAAPTGAMDRLIAMPARRSQGPLPLSLIPRASSPGPPACSRVMRRRREWRAPTDPHTGVWRPSGTAAGAGGWPGRGGWIICGGHVAMSAENQARRRAESERSAPAVCRCVEMMDIVILWHWWHARVLCPRDSRAWNGLS